MNNGLRNIFIKGTIFSILIGAFYTTKSQNLQIILDPVVQNTSGSLFNLSLINNSASSGTAKLLATLRTRKGKLLLKQEVTIEISAREVKRIDKNLAQTVYIDDGFSKLYIEGQSFPPYDYILCVNGRFIGDIGSEIEPCIEYLSSDFLSLIPTYPDDNEIIYQPQPVFSWLNTNIGYNYTYDFTLVNMEKNQNSNASIRRNLPLVQRSDLNETSLFYPSDATPLENGKEYAWQLGIKLNGEEIAKSDAYTFIYKEGDEYMDIPRDLSYVDIKVVPKGASLYAVGVFKFRFDSNIEDELNLSIYDIEKEKWISLEQSTLKIYNGENKFDFDLKEQVYLRHNKKYLLKITDNKKSTYIIQITFLNPDYLK